MTTAAPSGARWCWPAASGPPRGRALRAPQWLAPELVEPIVPRPDDPFVVKARHSIFYQTQVEYLLREALKSRGIGAKPAAPKPTPKATP